jgi:hypothetical protein
MSKYRDVAIKAVGLIKSGFVSSPSDALEKATLAVFPNSVSLRDKGCPKGAFIGLCNEGLIDGIPKGSYARSGKNGEYALKAIDILRTNRFLTSQPELLWKKVAGNTKSTNGQMDVVIGLWEAKCIITEPTMR